MKVDLAGGGGASESNATDGFSAPSPGGRAEAHQRTIHANPQLQAIKDYLRTQQQIQSDRILTGVTLTGGLTPALLNGTGRYWDLGATGNPLSGVTVIAHRTDTPKNMAIAYAAPGALRPGCAAQYFMVGGNSGAGDENIFTADGEKVFLNAVASLIPAAGPFSLKITRNPDTPGNYDFTWESQDGKVYDLVRSTDISSPVSSWSIWNGRSGIDGTAPENTLANMAGGGDAYRFFAVVERDGRQSLTRTSTRVTVASQSPSPTWAPAPNVPGACRIPRTRAVARSLPIMGAPAGVGAPI